MRSDAERSVKFSVAAKAMMRCCCCVSSKVFSLDGEPLDHLLTGLHEILQSCSENYDNQQPTFFTHHSIYGLRESSTERNPLSMSWNYHQRLLFPLYTVYMAQSTDDRSTNCIPGQRGHQKTDLFTLAGQESIYNWIHNPIYLYVNGVYLMED
jgi:hypothetical protein